MKKEKIYFKRGRRPLKNRKLKTKLIIKWIKEDPILNDFQLLDMFRKRKLYISKQMIRQIRIENDIPCCYKRSNKGHWNYKPIDEGIGGAITKIINSENIAKPYSDAKIMKLLKLKYNIILPKRTIGWWRYKKLNIPTFSLRKIKRRPRL